MTTFLLNQDFPFLSPSKTSIYEVKLLKRKSEQLFSTIGTKKCQKNMAEYENMSEVLKKIENDFHRFIT